MSSWSLSALKQFADQVQDGASKLAETAKEGLNQAASALDEQLKATASLAASKVPTAAPIDGPPAVAAELATGPTASPAPSAVNSRPVSPVQRGPEEPATRTVDDSAFNGVRKSSEVKAASFGDLQMENTALRDQLHDALSQMASLQTKLKDTTGQLDLVKQKARVKLASLTKEVEELKKRGPDAASPASPGQGSPLSHVGDGASQDTRIPELEALVASRAAELESERRRAEAAEEKLSTLQRGMEAQADSDRAAADADRASSRVRVTELESQLAESEARHGSELRAVRLELEARVSEFETRAKALQDELENAAVAGGDSGNLAKELEALLEEERSENDKRQVALESELRELRGELEAARRADAQTDFGSGAPPEPETAELRAKLDAIALERDEAMDRVSKLSEKAVQLQRRLEEVQEELSRTRLDCEAAAHELGRTRMESEAAVEVLQRRLLEAETRLADALSKAHFPDASSPPTPEPEALSQMADQLAAKDTEAQELRERLHDLSGKLEEARDELARSKSTAPSLADRASPSVEEHDDALKRIRQLEEELQQNISALATHQELLRRAEESIEELRNGGAAKEADQRAAASAEPVVDDEKHETDGAPPPYSAARDISAFEQEIRDLKSLVEDLRQNESPAGAWEEEKRRLEEAASKTLADAQEEAQRRIAELERLLDDARTIPADAGATAGVTAEASSTRLRELETRNFTLEEQVRDFSLQIKARTDTISKQQEQMGTLKSDLERAKAEHEEKFRKMKAILGQANKNISDTREKLAAAEKEKERLAGEVEAKEEDLRQVDAERRSLRAELDRLERELADERELRDNMLVELEGKNRQLQTDLNMARSEFQKYKVKAAVALQQNSSTALEARISELEEAKGRLERERSQQRNELEAAVARSAAAEAELSASLDRIELLEGRIRSLENLGKDAGVARQEFETLRNTVELDKARANEALRARDAEWEAKLVSARKDMDARLQDAGQALRQKEDETGSLRAISEGLSSQLTAARDEITGLRKELDETKRSAAAWAVAAAGHQRNAGEEGLFSASSVQPSSPFAAAPPPYQYASGSSAAAGQSAKRGQQGSSLQDLLSRRDSIDSVTSSTQGPGMSSREKEFAAKLAHMAELLNESEAQVTRLMEQEALLKEEIRSMDRADKRANLNIEYLKNVLLQFLESPSERPQLVLVLTNILQLTRNEANRLKASVGDGDPVSAAANSIGSALGLW